MRRTSAEPPQPHGQTPDNGHPPSPLGSGPAPSAGSALLGQPPPGEPARTLIDGAAARHAAYQVAQLTHLTDELEARPISGRSLDGELGHTVAERERGRSSALVRRVSGQLAQSPLGRLAQRAEQALRPATIKAWLRHTRMQTRSEVVDPFGLDPVVTERWRPIFEFLYRNWWGVETSGMEHLPDHGRALIVANHGGVLPYDSVMLMYAIRYDHPAHRTARPLIEDVIYHLPFLGVRLNRLGCVRASQQNAEHLLHDDNLVIVFPEGGKGTSKLQRDRYQLQRFGRGGFVKLALRTRTPIIPAAIVGAEDAHPLLARFNLGSHSPLPFLPITASFPWLGPFGLLPRRERWLIRFDKPIVLSEHGPEADQDSLLVTRINDQVRSRIQTTLDALLAERDGVS